MPTLNVPTQVIDAATGEVIEKKTTEFRMVPPKETACPICAVDPKHGSDEPHNAQSLYYQYGFYATHGRWPTWKDALAHCSEPVRAAWEAELRKRGAWRE
jgi:hypothetical protein